MEKKISHSSDKLKSQDKPGFHRAKGKQTSLTIKEKKQSEQGVHKKHSTRLKDN
ncbi:MAG: hypothetical protein QM737_16155 [Ferruginibacter sp.]